MVPEGGQALVQARERAEAHERGVGGVAHQAEERRGLLGAAVLGHHVGGEELGLRGALAVPGGGEQVGGLQRGGDRLRPPLERPQGPGAGVRVVGHLPVGAGVPHEGERLLEEVEALRLAGLAQQVPVRVQRGRQHRRVLVHRLARGRDRPLEQVEGGGPGAFVALAVHEGAGGQERARGVLPLAVGLEQAGRLPPQGQRVLGAVLVVVGVAEVHEGAGLLDVPAVGGLAAHQPGEQGLGLVGAAGEHELVRPPVAQARGLRRLGLLRVHGGQLPRGHGDLLVPVEVAGHAPGQGRRGGGAAPQPDRGHPLRRLERQVEGRRRTVQLVGGDRPHRGGGGEDGPGGGQRGDDGGRRVRLGVLAPPQVQAGEQQVRAGPRAGGQQGTGRAQPAQDGDDAAGQLERGVQVPGVHAVHGQGQGGLGQDGVPGVLAGSARLVLHDAGQHRRLDRVRIAHEGGAELGLEPGLPGPAEVAQQRRPGLHPAGQGGLVPDLARGDGERPQQGEADVVLAGHERGQAGVGEAGGLPGLVAQRGLEGELPPAAGVQGGRGVGRRGDAGLPEQGVHPVQGGVDGRLHGAAGGVVPVGRVLRGVHGRCSFRGWDGWSSSLGRGSVDRAAVRGGRCS